MKATWLTEELKSDVRRIFEPRYKRSLTEEEVFEIATNLTSYMETILKWKWSHYAEVSN